MHYFVKTPKVLPLIRQWYEGWRRRHRRFEASQSYCNNHRRGLSTSCPKIRTLEPVCPEIRTLALACPETQSLGPACPEIQSPGHVCPRTLIREPSCPRTQSLGRVFLGTLIRGPACPGILNLGLVCPKIRILGHVCPEIRTQGRVSLRIQSLGPFWCTTTKRNYCIHKAVDKNFVLKSLCVKSSIIRRHSLHRLCVHRLGRKNRKCTNGKLMDKSPICPKIRMRWTAKVRMFYTFTLRQWGKNYAFDLNFFSGVRRSYVNKKCPYVWWY